MIDISCYDNIIGLANKDCECLETGRPETYNESNSGLFITDLIPLEKITGLESCTKGTIWEILERARNSGVLAFIADTNALMLENFQLRRELTKGSIGQKKGRTAIVSDKIFLGIRIFPAPVNSGVLHISNIGTLFEGTGEITLKIYNNFNEKIGDDITLNSIADRATDNPQSIDLPLYSKYGQLEYYFVYLKNNANKPLDNQISCGCDHFRPVFNTSLPYFDEKHEGRYKWANWTMVGNYGTDDITSFDEEQVEAASNYMNGLYLDVELRCNIQEVMCKDSLDFTGNPLAIAMAHAIKYKAAELAANELLKSADPNFETLINADKFKASLGEWRTKYIEMTTYISSNANIYASDCLCEKNVIGLMVKGIFA